MDLERYFELRTILHTWKSQLAENLRSKVEASSRFQRRLRTLYEQEGTSEGFTVWLDLWCRQASIQWILRVLFLRVLEDRSLLGITRIRNTDGQHMWGMLARNLGAASYLLWCCRDAAYLLPDLFGPTEFDFLLPDDELVQRFFDDVWRRPDPNRAGWLRFDFRSDPEKADEGFQTRFIGDLYQELDSEIRKRHALLQTPHFISQFILENTLLKRFEEKDFRTVTLIDPTCGSGHFLVDAFRMFVTQYEKALGRNRELLTVVERTRITRRVIEEHIFGCDINPYATTLARFRLTLAACDYAHPASLRDLRDLHLNVVEIDSLIPYESIVKSGAWGGEQTARILGHPDDIQRALPVLQRRYDVVVGNPPYILASDPIKRELYREHYASAYSKFGLSAPFTERFLHLAVEGGVVGLINSNAFARRQFGKVLIEKVLPHYDLQAVIDLSGAYIPGHGTPTLILFARNQQPSSEVVIILSNLKGEPGIPANPAQGKVWQSVICGYAKGPGYTDEYVDVTARQRLPLSKHPWQFGEAKSILHETICQNSSGNLDDIADSIGITVFTLADDVYQINPDYARRLNISVEHLRYMFIGEGLRDWLISNMPLALFPYEKDLKPFKIENHPAEQAYLINYKNLLSNTILFGGRSKVESGLNWFEYGRFSTSKYDTEYAIVQAFITTHNQFILTGGKELYNRSAQIIKLRNANHEDYKFVTGILNTNTICFCLKQTSFNKKPGRDPIRDNWEFSSTSVGKLPFPKKYNSNMHKHLIMFSLVEDMLGLVNIISKLKIQRIFEKNEESYYTWDSLLVGYISPYTDLPIPFTSAAELVLALQKLMVLNQDIYTRMIFLQEEMDWLAYEMYGLIPKAPLAEDYLNEADYKTARLELGQRPFEITGKGYKGDWLPAYQPAPLPDFLRHLTEARIAIIHSNPDIDLLEDPLYKRRWIQPDYDQEFQEAANWWLAEKLEFALEQYSNPVSLREWARLLRDDKRVNAVLEVLTGSPAFDLEKELLKVISLNAVPNRPEHYLKISGLRKVNDGAVPVAELASGDFSDPIAWRLRGKLNIPRERFIAYREFDTNWRGETIPDSGGPWFGWGGWGHMQRAEALATLLERANRAGWEIHYRQCGLRASLRALLPGLIDLPEAERGEFGAIAAACGIGLEARCYCQAYREAFAQGGLCAPGVSAEVLGMKTLEVETEKPRRGRSKGAEKPMQIEFDLE